MKGFYIYNGGLLTPKFIEIRDLFVQAFARRGVFLQPMTNDEAWLKEDFPSDSFCLFYDKDIPLCCKLEKSMPVFNSASSIALCDDKCLTASALSGRVKMPKQICAPLRFFGSVPDSFLEEAISLLGLPIVVKGAKGSFGAQIALCRTKEELFAFCKRLGEAPFLLQEYVEAGGRDARIYVVDGKVFASFARQAREGDFRANVTNGGSMLVYEPTEREKRLAIEACKGVGALFAGVDLIPAEDPVLLEVNSNAHFKNLLDFTSLSYADAVADCILRKLS